MTTTQSALLNELEPMVEANLNRHLDAAKPWNPHDYVPWSRGRDFAFLGGEDWTPEDSPLDDVAKAAMLVNLLTEDNLPSYHREIAVRFGPDGPWGQWVGQWTAEEARHSIAIRDYLIVTRGVDPVALEEGRMIHMKAGYNSGDKTMLEALAYVSLQELATRISHRNTGKASGCPLAEQLLTRVATDENLHMVFYRNLVDAAFDLAPNDTMRAIAHEVINFQMPGSTMPGFADNALLIAKAGIYDLRSHVDDVVRPVLRFWRVLERDDVDGDAARARDEMAVFLDLIEDKASHYERRRQQRLAGVGSPASERV